MALRNPALALFCAVVLLACGGGPVKRISPPTASVQQLALQAAAGDEHVHRHLQEGEGRDATERVLRAYRLYLAGSAMAFERGWLSLHQVLAAKPSGDLSEGTLSNIKAGQNFNKNNTAIYFAFRFICLFI